MAENVEVNFVGIGNILAAVLSWCKWHSIGWAIWHTLCGWLYVIWYAIFYWKP